jgi:hypothetical protein
MRTGACPLGLSLKLAFVVSPARTVAGPLALRETQFADSELVAAGCQIGDRKSPRLICQNNATLTDKRNSCAGMGLPVLVSMTRPASWPLLSSIPPIMVCGLLISLLPLSRVSRRSDLRIVIVFTHCANSC